MHQIGLYQFLAAGLFCELPCFTNWIRLATMCDFCLNYPVWLAMYFPLSVYSLAMVTYHRVVFAAAVAWQGQWAMTVTPWQASVGVVQELVAIAVTDARRDILGSPSVAVSVSDEDDCFEGNTFSSRLCRHFICMLSSALGRHLGYVLSFVQCRH